MPCFEGFLDTSILSNFCLDSSQKKVKLAIFSFVRIILTLEACMSKKVELGPMRWLTPTPEPILRATAEPCPDGFVTAWHRFPTENEPEAIIISKIFANGRKTGQVIVGRGADPDLLVTKDKVYVSWLQKDFATLLYEVIVSTFDHNLDLVGHCTVANGVMSVFGQPYLAIYQSQITVVYDSEKTIDGSTLHSHNLETHETISKQIAVGPLNDILVKYSVNHLIAVFETAVELRVFEFDGINWTHLTSIPVEAPFPHRFDFSLGEKKAMFVLAYEEDRLASLVINLSDGSHGKKWAFCDYGKFATLSMVSLDEEWVVSWVGAPALSLDKQGGSVNESFEGYVRALWEIKNRVEESERIYGSTRVRSEMEELWDATFIGPWAPLWLGLLNGDGKCVETYGPLGNEADENWNTIVTTKEGKGLLLWRNHERLEDADEESFLSYRTFHYNKNLCTNEKDPARAGP